MSEKHEKKPDISICMVSLNCWGVLRPCLDSLLKNESQLSYEVIIVDNGSTDELPDKIEKEYPFVKFIRNNRNVGFTQATNQGINVSTGNAILWLNTDTILQPDSLSLLWQFLMDHPSAGIVGPKVLNADGSFQPQCKRGLPTPLASLCYFLKLYRWLPRSKTANQYLLNHLDEDQTHEVDAISGCCLMARREVWDQIGSLDENIFAYGEDLDWCVRSKKAGWKVFYYPLSQIYHLKGQGGAHAKPYHKAWGMHHGMWVFYRKHLMHNYSFPITVAVVAGVVTSFVVNCVAITGRKLLHS